VLELFALDPEMVIIGGGLGLACAFQLRLIALAREHIYAADTRRLSIVGAALGRDVGVVGAAPAGDEVAAEGAVGWAAPVLVASRLALSGPAVTRFASRMSC
jgi:hypothetical protein